MYNDNYPVKKLLIFSQFYDIDRDLTDDNITDSDIMAETKK